MFNERSVCLLGLVSKFPDARDSNPPAFAGNLPFSANISGLPFSLNILPVVENLPSQEKIKVMKFVYQSFLADDSLPFFCGFSAIFTCLACEHESAIIVGAVMH